MYLIDHHHVKGKHNILKKLSLGNFTFKILHEGPNDVISTQPA
jgi:hypothetical protein